VLYMQLFFAIFQFCAYVKFTALDGNIATENKKNKKILENDTAEILNKL